MHPHDKSTETATKFSALGNVFLNPVHTGIFIIYNLFCSLQDIGSMSSSVLQSQFQLFFHYIH